MSWRVLAKPGGNATGLSDQATDIGGKRLALLQDATGGGKSFAVLMNPETPNSALALKEVELGAANLHIALKVLPVRSIEEIRSAIAGLAGGPEKGVMVLEDPLTVSARGQIVDLTTAQKLPTMFLFRESVAAGGLMSYGPDRRANYARAADYIDLILKGKKAADLPVEQPTRFQLVVNLKTAKALGLALPPTIVSTADEVIE